METAMAIPSVTAEDFKIKKIEKVKKFVNGEEITEDVETFEDVKVISRKDKKGRDIRHVLLEDGSIATVRKGKGKDVEAATLISNGDKSKYLTALMASTVTINDTPVIMEQLADFDMSDYMNLQIAFSEINF